MLGGCLYPLRAAGEGGLPHSSKVTRHRRAALPSSPRMPLRSATDLARRILMIQTCNFSTYGGNIPTE